MKNVKRIVQFIKLTSVLFGVSANAEDTEKICVSRGTEVFVGYGRKPTEDCSSKEEYYDPTTSGVEIDIAKEEALLMATKKCQKNYQGVPSMGNFSYAVPVAKYRVNYSCYDVYGRERKFVTVSNSFTCVNH
jgi:hypothetical protein